MTEAVVLVGLAVGGLAAVVWALGRLAARVRTLADAQGSREETSALLQRQIEAVREGSRREQEVALGAIRQEVAQFGGQLSQQLGQVQAAMATHLQGVTSEVNRRLQEGMALLQDAHTAMGQRLDRAATAMNQVHGQLGTLAEATRRLETVGKDIAGLEQVLRAPQARGGLGEVLLERLLSEALPAASYRLQHAFRSGDRVDAVIALAGRLVPVDSKFPLENFRRLTEESQEERRRPARRAFYRDVRNRIDEIAKKYVLPDEGTFDFALMYIPAESVYYEVITGGADEGEDATLAYALTRRVIPVSPNGFYAYLQVIVLGLRGLRIEQRADEILGALRRLHADFGRFREQFETLGRHVTNAKNRYDETVTALSRFEARLLSVSAEEPSRVEPSTIALGAGTGADDAGAPGASGAGAE